MNFLNFFFFFGLLLVVFFLANSFSEQLPSEHKQGVKHGRDRNWILWNVLWRAVLLRALSPCCSESGLQTHNISIICELLRKAPSQAPPWTCWNRICILPRISRNFLASVLLFTDQFSLNIATTKYWYLWNYVLEYVLVISNNYISTENFSAWVNYHSYVDQ